jgi:hypothetical protein
MFRCAGTLIMKKDHIKSIIKRLRNLEDYG